jgi:N6-adenosine-specific RNA methylase IME4
LPVVSRRTRGAVFLSGGKLENSLTIIEQTRLEQCEAVIDQGLKTFTDVGKALLEIRDLKLYRKEYDTFENYCQKRWGWERRHAYRMIDAAQVVENVSHGTQIVPISERQARPLTSLEPDQQREAWQRVIEKAPATGITASLVLEAAKEIQQIKRDERRIERIEKIVDINSRNKPLNDGLGKFNIILADPPWQYEHPISDSRRIENQYPTMPIEEICSLPVKDISENDAIIFLWASTPMLKKGLQVMDAWGFEYRTSMVWVKPSIGPGHWVRQRHEFLLIGVKGSLPTPESENKPDSVIEAPREEHSKKPEKVYELIEKMFPELSKVELFCRQPRLNWSVWGNESE